MRYSYLIPFLSLLFFVLTVPVHAEVSCHCFQDRTYNPDRPAAADIYFLATAQNSLIAAALDVPKRSIVQAKMGGADADLLWVTYYIANRTGLEVADLVELLASSGVDGLMARLANLKAGFDKPFLSSIMAGADLAQLARGAHHSVMVTQVGVDVALLERLEMKGANRQEQILAIFVSKLLAEDAVDIYSSVRAGEQTWGQAFASTGLDASQIEASWRKLMGMHRAGMS